MGPSKLSSDFLRHLTNKKPNQKLDLTNLYLALIILAGSALRFFQLFRGLNEDYSFRQAQTAFVSLKLSEDGLSLFNTPLPIFGNESNVPFELPVFQNIVAFLHLMGVPIEIAGRSLGLFFFQITGVLVFVIAAKWFNKKVAFTAIVLFELLPFGLYWGAAFLIEFLATSLSLAVVVVLEKWARKPTWYLLVVAAFFSVLAYSVKITTAPIYSILLFVYIFQFFGHFPFRRAFQKSLLVALAGPISGLTVGLLWTRFADRIKNQSIETSWLTSSKLREWNFGSPAQYLNPESYFDAYTRIENLVSGPFLFTLLFCAFAAISCVVRIDRVKIFFILFCSLFPPVLFVNLYKVHTYYISAIYPLLCIASAIGLVQIAVYVTKSLKRQNIAITILVIFIMISNVMTPDGAKSFQALYKVRPIQSLSEELILNTKSNDEIVMVGCDWNPIYLFEARREGLMVVDHIYRTPTDVWNTKDINDYSYIARCYPDIEVANYLPAGITYLPVSNNVFQIVK